MKSLVLGPWFPAAESVVHAARVKLACSVDTDGEDRPLAR